jgi:hypothetical protein
MFYYFKLKCCLTNVCILPLFYRESKEIIQELKNKRSRLSEPLIRPNEDKD